MRFNPFIAYNQEHTLTKAQTQLYITSKCNKDIIYRRIMTLENYLINWFRKKPFLLQWLIIV
jgi:hypothetical protein